MIHYNFCTSCKLDLTIDGHDDRCSEIADEYRIRVREHLFQTSKTVVAHRQRIWVQSPRTRAKRSQVLVSRVKSDGTVDKRFKFRKLS